MELIRILDRLFDLQSFLLIALVFVPLERLFALRRSQKVLRKGWRRDLVYVFANRLFILAGLVVLVAGVGVAAHGLVPSELQAAIARQPLWLQVVQAVLLADLGFYGAHRLFHAVPALWRLHRIHHSIEELDWLAAARVHPLDQVATKGASLIPLFALGFSPAAFAVQAAIYMWQSYLVHSNVRIDFGPLRWVIASPAFHHWHHANEPQAYNRNYAGQLSLLDGLLGTLYMPPGRAPSRYGAEPVPEDYVSQLLDPFRAPDHPGGGPASSAIW